MDHSQPSSIPIFTPELDTRALKALRLMLASDSSLRLVAQDGGAIDLSPAVRTAFEQLVRIMAIGKSVAILPYERYLSCQEAAELLGISRPYFYKLLDRGAIPYFKVGSHRRVRFEDVIDYKLNRSNERHQALLELAELSKKLGLFSSDDDP